jgi:hypothetical protein
MLRVQRTAATARGGDASELVGAVRLWLSSLARRIHIPDERRRGAES